MRHHNTNRTFGLTRSKRKAFFISLSEALILKELRKVVEPMITMAKKPTLATRRLLIARLDNREKVAKKIIDILAPRYKDRKGGYTRVTKVFKKSTDARKHALIEFV